MARILFFWLLICSVCPIAVAAEAKLLPELPLAAGKLLFVAEDVYSGEVEAQELSAGRRELSAACFERARESCGRGDVAGALQWATRALRVDPDHTDARRVLGYRRVGNQWAGGYAARRMERGEVWNREFGWIAEVDVARYEAGERPLGKRWVSVEEDARRHSTIDKGWQIRTDHFRVVTNESRAAAVELALRLERLYQIWLQLFGDFYLEDVELLKRFDGQEGSSYRSKPFQVAYYATRDEYNAKLRRQQPRIEMTLGIYFDGRRKSHFFAGEEQDAGTINHEAVHQFFYESNAKTARHVGTLANAWLVEGVACYFESLVEHNDPELGRFYLIGTPRAGRLPAAQQRRLVDDYYVPLAELSALGMSDFQRRDDLPRLYSQSAGLTTFLLHGREGAYRPALLELLKAIYSGRDKADSLAELTGKSFEELDAEYLEFLKRLP